MTDANDSPVDAQTEPSARFIPAHPPLTECAVEAEKYVAASGWDQPIRLFALVDAARFAAAEPQLADQVDAEQEGYVTVEQDDLPEHDDVEDLLARIAWPAEVDGVAVALERIVLPPGAEDDLPSDAEAATQALLDHPDRADIRLLAAVSRTGERVCLVRQRAHDSDDAVASGEEIAPALLDALASTLED
ncbi:MAG: PPA1309 family protein [Mobilicoccus sp.]|nr:PPA1309 family protein [Mobilicoccus sp.]